MAIKIIATTSGTYLAYGLSSDTKPLSPPDGSLFIETDTGLIFAGSAAAWAPKTAVTSGTNTGDNAVNTLYSGLASSKLDTNGNGSALTGLTKSQVGLANVDNTSDASKPVSTAQQTALDNKQTLDQQLTDLAALVYTANALKAIRVNAAATGFELATITASLPDMVVTKNSVTADTVIASGYSAYISGGLEIASGFNLEIASGAHLEIG